MTVWMSGTEAMELVKTSGPQRSDLQSRLTRVQEKSDGSDVQARIQAFCGEGPEGAGLRSLLEIVGRKANESDKEGSHGPQQSNKDSMASGMEMLFEGSFGDVDLDAMFASTPDDATDGLRSHSQAINQHLLSRTLDHLPLAGSDRLQIFQSGNGALSSRGIILVSPHTPVTSAPMKEETVTPGHKEDHPDDSNSSGF